MSDASARLSAAASRIGSTLDLGVTAAEAVEAAVPEFADAAMIYAAERLLAADEPPPHGGREMILRRLAGKLDGFDEKVNASLLPVGEIIVFEHGTPGALVMASGEPVLYRRLDAQTARRAASRVGGKKAVGAYKSFLAVPLSARGITLGCMLLCRGPSRSPFTRKDADLAGVLADRAALCIDNARLYDNARRTAVALQRALMPGTLERPPGLDVASVYEPVGTYVIGGDWHDVVTLPGNRAALIVGDAMGHGPEAAAAMVQLRTAAHALAAVEISPARILSALDQMTESIEAAPFATCLVMFVDTMSGSGVAARAGHLPPMVAVPGGQAKAVRIPAGLPLGVGAASYTDTTFELPAGAALAVYTDGLVENRARPVDEGMAALCDELERTLPAAESSLESACEEIARTLGQDGGDDITLVLARIRC